MMSNLFFSISRKSSAHQGQCLSGHKPEKSIALCTAYFTNCVEPRHLLGERGWNLRDKERELRAGDAEMDC